MFKLIILLFISMSCNAGFNDPTVPRHSTNIIQTEKQGGLVLSAILISSQSKRAIINGVTIKQGQSVIINNTDAIKVISITTNTVIVEQKGERKNMSLVNNLFKREKI